MGDGLSCQTSILIDAHPSSLSNFSPVLTVILWMQTMYSQALQHQASDVLLDHFLQGVGTMRQGATTINLYLTTQVRKRSVSWSPSSRRQPHRCSHVYETCPVHAFISSTPPFPQLPFPYVHLLSFMVKLSLAMLAVYTASDVSVAPEEAHPPWIAIAGL